VNENDPLGLLDLPFFVPFFNPSFLRLLFLHYSWARSHACFQANTCRRETKHHAEEGVGQGLDLSFFDRAMQSGRFILDHRAWTLSTCSHSFV